MALATPVALLIFNRPDLTRQVFARVRAQQPDTLLVVADGPRSDTESSLCEETRATVVDAVDWPCDLRVNFSPTNLGCRSRVSSGLDWVFAEVEQAIVLEDDCLPVPSFFSYCDRLLEHYRDDERVMHIGGVNFVPELWSSSASYRFSRNAHVWGWASWRRAWAHYDVSMTRWPEFDRAGLLEGIANSRTEASFYRNVFARVTAGEIDTWDYQWQFACWTQSGVATVPRHNLVRNLGFRSDGTHTQGDSPLADLDTYDLGEVRHPELIAIDAPADRAVFHLETALATEWDSMPRRARSLVRKWGRRWNQWRR